MIIKERKKYLKEQNYDGLCSDGCGCGLDNFAPCCAGIPEDGEMAFTDCTPSYKITSDSKEWKVLREYYKDQGSELELEEMEVYDYFLSLKKFLKK